MSSKQVSQLCWACKKAVNKGCSWSKEFIPVEGWKAEPSIVTGTFSYSISECPEFESDNACESCRNISNRQICKKCTYYTQNGKGSSIKWEGDTLFRDAIQKYRGK